MGSARKRMSYPQDTPSSKRFKDLNRQRRPIESLNKRTLKRFMLRPQRSWMRRAPQVSSSASTHALRVDPERSSTGLASGVRGLGQQQQVGDFLRCAAPMSYP